MRFSILPVLFLVGCSSSSTAPSGGTDAGSGGTGGATSGTGGSTSQSGGAGGAGTGGKTSTGGTTGQKDGGSGGTTSGNPDGSAGAGGTTGNPDSGTPDSGATPDAAPPVTHTLKIEDYLSWCSVGVNGGASSTAATTTLTFPEGTVVNLHGDKATGTFVFGYWRGTSGDTSASHDTQVDTTVTMDGDKTIQACCPFANDPTTPCPDPT